MKTFLILAALLLAFGLVGEIDYQTTAGLAAEHSRYLPLVAAAEQGDDNHVAR